MELLGVQMEASRLDILFLSKGERPYTAKGHFPY